MQTYIQPLKKPAEGELKVRIDADILSGLEEYCQFLESPKGYVVTEVLRKALRKDKAFTLWRTGRDGSPISRSEVGKRGRSRGAGPTAAA